MICPAPLFLDASSSSTLISWTLCYCFGLIHLLPKVTEPDLPDQNPTVLILYFLLAKVYKNQNPRTQSIRLALMLGVIWARPTGVKYRYW